MLKYIGKNIITKALIIAGVALFLYAVLTPDNPPMWVPSYNTNEYIPMDGRIAVYRFAGYKTGLGIKYTNQFDHEGTRFYAPPSDDIPLNIISRKSFFKYRLYEFSHFIVGETPEFDSAVYDLTPYDFNDVLEIYGVDSPWKIKSADHHFINYSEGTITDKDDIKTLYDILSDVECVGYNDENYSGTDITINLRNGKSIDGLIYSRTHGAFFYRYHTFHLYSITAFVAHLDETQQAQIEALIYD